MDKVEMFVPYWTINKKYDCPECNEKRTIKHPEYICEGCGIEFQLKVKMFSIWEEVKRIAQLKKGLK